MPIRQHGRRVGKGSEAGRETGERSCRSFEARQADLRSSPQKIVEGRGQSCSDEGDESYGFDEGQSRADEDEGDESYGNDEGRSRADEVDEGHGGHEGSVDLSTFRFKRFNLNVHPFLLYPLLNYTNRSPELIHKPPLNYETRSAQLNSNLVPGS